MKTYFITGATGVIGGAIAETLLSRQDVRLKLLVRANSDVELAQREQALLQCWRQEAAAGRIEVLRGDTTLSLFGLAPADYTRMARECTHLIHCAAMVRMNLPIEEARRSAVAAAEGLVHLARACRDSGQLEKIEFVSTVGVGGRLAGLLPERRITESRGFHNTYEQAKAEAEEYLEAAGQGLPMTIHRPSMVVGDSRTGRIRHFQIFYHLIEFLSGLRTYGILPRFGETRLDVVPVDYVANAIVWSSTESATAGKTLHLCSGPEGAISLRMLRTHLRKQFALAGKKTPAGFFVPPGLFGLMLPVLRAAVSPRLRRAVDTLPIFLDYLAENQAFSNEETRSLLARQGIALPEVEAYLPQVLSFYLQR